MTMQLPTVAIRHPLDPNVLMTINAVDYREAEHELWVEPVPATDEFRVSKGARGLWFVKRGAEAVSPGYQNEAEAEAAKAALQA